MWGREYLIVAIIGMMGGRVVTVVIVIWRTDVYVCTVDIIDVHIWE